MTFNQKAITFSGAFICAYAAFTGTFIARGHPDHPERRGAVVIQGYQVMRYDTDGHVYTGIGVYCSSSSSNAPVFPPAKFYNDGTSGPVYPLAEAIAQLLDAGYHIEKTDGINFVMTK